MKAWDTNTLEVVELILAGRTIEAGIGTALVYFCLTPETYQGFVLQHKTTKFELKQDSRLEPLQWFPQTNVHS